MSGRMYRGVKDKSDDAPMMGGLKSEMGQNNTRFSINKEK